MIYKIIDAEANKIMIKIKNSVFLLLLFFPINISQNFEKNSYEIVLGLNFTNKTRSKDAPLIKDDPIARYRKARTVFDDIT